MSTSVVSVIAPLQPKPLPDLFSQSVCVGQLAYLDVGDDFKKVSLERAVTALAPVQFKQTTSRPDVACCQSKIQLANIRHDCKVLQKRLRAMNQKEIELERRERDVVQRAMKLTGWDMRCEEMARHFAEERKVFELKLAEGRLSKEKYAKKCVRRELAKQRKAFNAELEAIVAQRVERHLREMQASGAVVVIPEEPASSSSESDEELEDNDDDDGGGDVDVRKKASLLDGEDTPAMSTSTRCVVCLTNQVKVRLEPCQHVSMCIDCAPRYLILTSDTNCPVCRAKVADFHVE